MLRMHIVTKLWDRLGWAAVPVFVSLSAVFCLCLPIFLILASFVLFITIVFLFCWMPVRLSMFLLNALPKATTSQIAPASSVRIQDRDSPRITGNQVGFVQPPAECSGEEIIRPTIGPLEQLSGEILEEITNHLPASSIGCLALVSKKFGTQFRFRYVHSGTERCSLTRFKAIASEPRLGQFTTQMIVHPTFFRPSLKVQWLFDGSKPSVVEAARIARETKKQWLLGVVLEACPRIRSLTWTEGDLPLFPTILQTLQTRLSTSLKHLDISVDSQLLPHLLGIPPSPPYNMRLTSLTLRGSISQGNADAIANLVFMTATTLRRVRFVDACFSDEPLGNPSPIDAVMKVIFGVRHQTYHRIVTLI
jgi:hypothetical protein